MRGEKNVPSLKSPTPMQAFKKLTFRNLHGKRSNYFHIHSEVTFLPQEDLCINQVKHILGDVKLLQAHDLGQLAVTLGHYQSDRQSYTQLIQI